MRIGSTRQAAFTLIEVVIAMGIISFALVAVFGLFPVGYRSALESRHETRAAFIAEQLLGDLQNSARTNARIFYGVNPQSLESLPLDLNAQGALFLACDAANVPATAVDLGTFNGGLADPDVSYLVAIHVTPTGFSDVTRVEVEVTVPPNVPLSARTHFGIVRLLRSR